MLTSARHQQCCTMRCAEESEIAPVTSSRVAAPCSALQKQKKTDIKEPLAVLVAKRPRQEREAEEPPPKKPTENASKCLEFAPGNKQELKVRRVKIKREMLESFGYTRGCSGCIGIQRGLQTRGHSEECRRRIETRLREQGHEGLARAEKRMQQSRSLQRSKLQAATETKQ